MPPHLPDMPNDNALPSQVQDFVEGEQALTAWMAENAFVSCMVRGQPWELEDQLIRSLDLPLNLDGNSRHQFHPVLSQIRRTCVAEANALPVVPNPGIGGSHSPRIWSRTSACA